MHANDPPITEIVPDGDDVDHHDRLERAGALGSSGPSQRPASGAASGDRNDIVLKALTDGATVRIRVSGEIWNAAAPAKRQTKRDRSVATSRIDGTGERNSLRFSGDIVEFERLDGDVEVTLNGEEVDPVTLDLPNEIVLSALTDEAKVRIAVSGAIATDRVAGEIESICDGHVLISRIQAKDDPDSFRFSGDVVEFKVMSGDVNVSVTVASREPRRTGDV